MFSKKSTADRATDFSIVGKLVAPRAARPQALPDNRDITLLFRHFTGEKPDFGLPDIGVSRTLKSPSHPSDSVFTRRFFPLKTSSPHRSKMASNAISEKSFGLAKRVKKSFSPSPSGVKALGV